MTAIAPLSVLIVGMLGLLIAFVAVARIVHLERRLATRATAPVLLPTPAPFPGNLAA